MFNIAIKSKSRLLIQYLWLLCRHGFEMPTSQSKNKTGKHELRTKEAQNLVMKYEYDQETYLLYIRTHWCFLCEMWPNKKTKYAPSIVSRNVSTPLPIQMEDLNLLLRLFLQSRWCKLVVNSSFFLKSSKVYNFHFKISDFISPNKNISCPTKMSINYNPLNHLHFLFAAWLFSCCSKLAQIKFLHLYIISLNIAKENGSIWSWKWYLQ